MGVGIMRNQLILICKEEGSINNYFQFYLRNLVGIFEILRCTFEINS